MENRENSDVSPGIGEITRREFIITGATAVALAGCVSSGEVAEGDTKATPDPHLAKVSFKVNGKPWTLELDTRTTLLDALREHLKLTGTKKGCDQGQCGACTVIADGRRINSCLTLAISHDGQEITTIEGLAQGAELHAVQAAFIEHDGFQCGYCTPGQICSAAALLEE